MFKKFILIFTIITLFAGAQPLRAAPLSEASSLTITAIYPNAPGSAERGHEFVTITNNAEVALTLHHLRLGLQGKINTFELGTIEMSAQESLTIFLPFALPNSGATVEVYLDENTTAALQAAYPSDLSDTQAWTLTHNQWSTQAPAPATKTMGPELPSSSDPVTTPQESTCQADEVRLSEVLADPEGTDKEGGEFVELYNPSTATLSLDGCALTTDKLPDGTSFGKADRIEPGQYLAISLEDGLLNHGGTVQFIGATHEDSVEYPALSVAQAWAFIGEEWQKTTTPTPGAANILPVEAPAKAEDQSETSNSAQSQDALSACPAGKYRNPATNRCKTLEAEENSAPAPCDPGQERNPDTHRCRAIVTPAATTLSPCGPGEERNPATNRCRKISEFSTNTAAAKTTSGAIASNEQPSPKSRTNLLIIGAVAALAAGYAMFEYRQDLRLLLSRITTRLKRHPKDAAEQRPNNNSPAY